MVFFFLAAALAIFFCGEPAVFFDALVFFLGEELVADFFLGEDTWVVFLGLVFLADAPP